MIKKTILYFVLLVFIFLVIFNVIIDPKSFYSNIINSLSIWLFNVYPALFTFYIISNCLIKFNIIKKISFIARPFISFETNKAYELFITSVLVGNPSSIALIMNEFEDESITLNDTNKLLKVCSFFNPLYIIAIISTVYLLDIKYAFIIMISILITNIIIATFIKSNHKVVINKKNTVPKIKLDIIFDSINEAMSLLLMVAGIMVFSNIIKNSFVNFIDVFNIKSNLTNFIASLFEISTGLDDVNNLNLPLIETIAISTFMFGFQGLSVSMQSLNIIIDQKINYLPIFIIRVIQGVISGCISIIIMNII